MKKVKIEIEVIACDICGKEISDAVFSVKVDEPALDRGVEIGTQEKFNFHGQCANQTLIDKAKEIRNKL